MLLLLSNFNLGNFLGALLQEGGFLLSSQFPQMLAPLAEPGIS